MAGSEQTVGESSVAYRMDAARDRKVSLGGRLSAKPPTAVAIWALGAGMSGCLAATPAPADPPLESAVARRSVSMTPGGLRIHALRVGWVRVKTAHRTLTSPHLFRFARVVVDRTWAAWMPIVAYAIERTDGSIVLVDTGPSPDINRPNYFACDPSSDWFYRRNLAFDVDDGDTLLARMASAGLAAARVTDIVVTHFHADHMGQLARFPNAEVHVGPGNWPKHVGAFVCSLGDDWKPRIATYPDTGVVGFDRSQVLKDPRIRMVPLPGHTPGHAGVVVADGGRVWLIAGDAIFDRVQTERGRLAGVTEDVEAAYQSQAQIRTAIDEFDAVLLPAHDPAAFTRLARSSAQR